MSFIFRLTRAPAAQCRTIRRLELAGFVLIVGALVSSPLLAVTASAATPTFVQQAYADPQTNHTSVAATYSKAQSAGDTNIVAIGWNNATSTITSVADTKGNTYVVAAPVTRGNGMSQAIFYAKNIGSAAANANSVTVVFTASTAYVDLRVTEYSGLDAANPFDKTASATGAGSVAATAAVTTSVNNELIFAAGMTNATYSASGSGFTTRVITSPDADIVFDRSVTVAGSYSASATQSGSWIMQMATFRAAGAAADTTAPSIPAGLSGTVASSTQINLGWSASTDAVGVVGYKVFRNGTQIATTAATTYQDTGVAQGTTYAYNVAAYDAAGNTSALSNTANVTTSNPDTTAPTAPANLRATAVSTSEIDLAWSASTDAVGVTGYKVFRNGAQIATTVSPSYQNVSLTQGTTYTYTVNAYDAAGNQSAQSANASATTFVPTADTTPPSTPTNLVATAASSSRINLTWSASTDSVGVTGYNIYRNSSLVGTSATPSYGDTALSAGTTYSYAVAAFDANSNTSGRSATASATTSAAGPIVTALKQSTQNPHYFVDGSGKAVFLTGSHTWNNFQDWGANGTIQPIDFTAYVNMMKANNQNFTLLWTTELPTFCRFPSLDSNPPAFDVSIMPWQRTGPGLAADGKPKFDLTKFNQAFFDRLRSRAQQLNDAGIYAGVYAFTGEWLNLFNCGGGYPFTGANNINGVSDDGALSSITMTAPNAITAFQDAYVEKMVDTLNDLPNILWGTSEESVPESNWWNNHQIDHIKAYEATKPLQHPVGYGTFINTADSQMTTTNADWMAPLSRISASTSCGSGSPSCKVNINDSDHGYFGLWNDTAQQNRNYIWENFTQGSQVLFMDPYLVYYPRDNRNNCGNPVNGICSTPDSKYDSFRMNLGYTRRYADRMNLLAMTPQGSKSSTGAVLANTSATQSEFLVYTPNGGTFTVNLSQTTRSLAVEWFNPATGVATSGATVNGGSTSQSFTPPFSGDAVLYIHDAGLGAADTTAPTTPTGLAAQNVTNSQVGLSWAASTDNVGVTGYRVYRNGVLRSTAATTSYTDSGLSAGTTYAYTVAAVDAAGNSSAQSPALNVTTTTGTASAAPVFVQQAYAVPRTTPTIVNITYANAQAGGDLNIVAIGFNNTTSTIASVTDSKGNAYVAAAPLTRGSGVSQAIYYAKNIAAAAGGTNTVTVTFNVPTTLPDVRISEYGGLDATNPFDRTASAVGNGSTASTAAVSTGFAKELIYAAGMSTGAFNNAAAGFTTRVITSPNMDIAFDETVSTTGSYGTSANQSGGTWVLQMVTFKAAGQ